MEPIPGLAEVVAAVPPQGALRLVLFDNPAEASDAWSALEQAGGSAYQTRRFLLPWIAHQAPALGVLPRIAVGFDTAGQPAILLPFGIVRRGLLRAVVYLGGRDSNANMPLMAPHLDLDEPSARALLAEYSAQVRPSPDLFLLVNQPDMWRGRRNPFIWAEASRSPSAAFGAQVGSDAETFLAAQDSAATRKKLRSKATRLQSIGPVSLDRPASAHDAHEIVAASRSTAAFPIATTGTR
jgi:CelD/BcsL family acetyltransferase involved in cellulose biosynthesis